MTYTLRSIEARALPFRTVLLDFPSASSNSPFSLLFERMVSGVGFAFFHPLLLNQMSEHPEFLDKIPDGNVKQAFQHLATNPALYSLAWNFLCGWKLSKHEQLQLGVSARQISTTDAFASVLQIIASVIYAQTQPHQTLLFLIDECEKMDSITYPNCQFAWRDTFSKILDNKIGMILALTNENLTTFPWLIVDSRISRRLGKQNYVCLHPYTRDQVRTFLKGLLENFIDPAKRAALESQHNFHQVPGYRSQLYPFTDGAFEGYCSYLAAAPHCPKPSELLVALNQTLAAAVLAGAMLVDERFLEDRHEFVTQLQIVQ